jgi:hypothetical protein
MASVKPTCRNEAATKSVTAFNESEHSMAINLPPIQPPAEHRRADAEATKRAQDYRKHQQEQERRRREERERALIAESRRKASETSQKR